MLGLAVDSANVFAEDSGAQELDAAEEEEAAGKECEGGRDDGIGRFRRRRVMTRRDEAEKHGEICRRWRRGEAGEMENPKKASRERKKSLRRP